MQSQIDLAMVEVEVVDMEEEVDQGMLYSQVPNKQVGGENNQGGWKWFNITIIEGLE